MAKKDLGGVTELLAPLASTMPTQRAPSLKVVPDSKPAAPAAAPAAAEGQLVNQLFQLREPQRDQLERLARDAKLTTRAFILTALAAKGLDVTESDLLDRRKRRR